MANGHSTRTIPTSVRSISTWVNRLIGSRTRSRNSMQSKMRSTRFQVTAWSMRGLPINWTIQTSKCPSSGGISLARNIRSEEHTSELQSLMRISYAVFCLKKKKKKRTNIKKYKYRQKQETRDKITTKTYQQV